MALHQRSGKGSHLGTVLYEIDMLRHCHAAVGKRKREMEDNPSDATRAEYNLAIEGFLLHLRNLLGFLGSGQHQKTDIILEEPKTWAGGNIDQGEYSNLIKGWKKFDGKYGAAVEDKPSTCYDQISKYLQHCTTFRYERAKQWDVEGMFADINPLLEEFEARFVTNGADIRANDDDPMGGPGSTASIRRLG